MGKMLYRVQLSDEERQRLTRLTKTGIAPARAIQRAQILLLLDENRSGGPRTCLEVVDQLKVSRDTVSTVKRQYSLEGLEAVLQRKKREIPAIPAKVDDNVKSHIQAIRSSEPPAGTTRWTLKMIANRVVELKLVGSLSAETVRRVLKKEK